MSPTVLSSGIYAQLQTWIKSNSIRKRRLRDRRETSPVFGLAAEVSELEARLLLTVTYQGGALLQNVEAQPIFIGSGWNTNPTLVAQKAQLDTFVKTIVDSPYMDMLTNAGYNVGRGSAKDGVVDAITLNKTTGISQAQIQAEIQSLIKAGKVQAPNANTLYVVYLEPGVPIAGKSASVAGFHTAFAGKTASGAAADIRYEVVKGTTNLNTATWVTSHELAESVTDPDMGYKKNGWFDVQKATEIGDLGQGSYSTLNGFLVQNVVNPAGKLITPTTVQAPLATVAAPGNVQGAATSTTSATLIWNNSPTAQGYKIYRIDGTQATLVATAGWGQTSAVVKGLTAGSTVTFKVQAYNYTSSTDSAAVTVKVPLTASGVVLAAPTVSLKAVSSTSALVGWNTVIGATGYRVYYLLNGKSILLGTFSATTKSMTVGGLPAGGTSKFMVQAFNSTKYTNSTWYSLTTPKA